MGLFSIEKNKKRKVVKLANSLPVWTTRWKKGLEIGRLFGFIPVYSVAAPEGVPQEEVQTVFKFVVPDSANDLANAVLDRDLESLNFRKPKIDNSILLSHLKELEPFTYIPNPGNAGDMLILKATLDFFQSNGLQYELYDGKNIRKNIVYGGGGIWIQAYKNTWGVKILPFFHKAERILILPSSFNDCPELTHDIDSRFTVFCRDRKSFDYMSEQCKTEVILDHDMAFRLSETTFEKNNVKFTDAMFQALTKTLIPSTNEIRLMRTDSESTGNKKTDLDLSNTFTSMEPDYQHALFGTKLLAATINRFNVIHTDRLHVSVMATMLGKTVYLHDNSYGKCSGVYLQSMQAFDNIKFVG